MSEFVSHLVEQLEPLGPVSAKRMFGGHGIYVGELMIAIVDDDTLYLKADDENRGDFERAQLPRFEYRKQGKLQTISYYLAPESALEDADCLCDWARKSYDAALRAKSPRGKRSAKRQ